VSRKEPSVAIMCAPAIDERVHVCPLRNDAVGALSGLDHVGMTEPRPICLNLLVGIQEILLTSGLHPEADGV
jgi:hypothetical protein